MKLKKKKIITYYEMTREQLIENNYIVKAKRIRKKVYNESELIDNKRRAEAICI